MPDISGFGLRVQIVASVTFPQGINLTQFADDQDPLDMASIQIADKAMGLNGDLIIWSKANPLPAVLNIVPNSDDDRNLSVLAENNRVGKGKTGTRDVITMTIIYPGGATITLSQGAITDAMFGQSVASSSRMKSKTYAFSFENKVET